MFKESHYRPLPKSVIIKHSEIDGLGLFALEDIPKDTNLGITHVWVMNMWIRTPLGGFINHCARPNAEAVDHVHDGYQDVPYRTCKTIEDVKAGDEITFYYSLKEYELAENV